MDVVLLFGLTELKAYIAWKEDVRSKPSIWKVYLIKYKIAQGVEKRCVSCFHDIRRVFIDIHGIEDQQALCTIRRCRTIVE